MSYIRNIRRYQEGGPMPEDAGMEPGMEDQGMPMEGGPEGSMPPEQGGGGEDPMMMMAQAAMQALQNQDCNAAMQVCQMFMELMQQMQGGGPEGGGMPPEQGEPVYAKNGGRLLYRI